jgi:hypothetical protein
MKKAILYPQDYEWVNIYQTKDFPMGNSKVEEAIIFNNAGFQIVVDRDKKVWHAESGECGIGFLTIDPIAQLILNFMMGDESDVEIMAALHINDYEKFQAKVLEYVTDAVHVESLDQYDEIAAYVKSRFDILPF